MPPWLIQALRLAGGFFVLYLAFSAAQAWRRDRPVDISPELSQRQSLFKAALVNILNPNPYLGWSLVLGPLLLKGWRETPSHGIALLAGFYGTMVLSLAGIIALFATASALGPRVRRILLAASAVALAGFGGYLLWSGLTALSVSSAA